MPDLRMAAGTTSNEDPINLERLALLEDEKIVDKEIADYERDGRIDRGHSEYVDFDLTRWWQVRLATSSLIIYPKFSLMSSEVQTGYIFFTLSCRPQCPSCSGIGCPMRARFFIKQRDGHETSVQS